MLGVPGQYGFGGCVMFIELSWTVTASDIREAGCCVCNKKFTREVIEANLVSDADRLHLGEVCPECIGRGAKYIEERMRKNLTWSVSMALAQARMERRALGEVVEACPSPEEYEALKAGVGGPRYASQEEAEAAYERGEW